MTSQILDTQKTKLANLLLIGMRISGIVEIPVTLSDFSELTNEAFRQELLSADFKLDYTFAKNRGVVFIEYGSQKSSDWINKYSKSVTTNT